MQVYSQERIRLCLLEGYTKLAITKKLADGDKTLTFQYPENGVAVQHLKNECYIVTHDDEYVLKEISKSKKYLKFTAQLNLEDLQGKQFASFETVEKTVRESLTAALDGTGWKVGKCSIKKKRTIRKDNVCTVLDIIDQIISTYKVEVEYHTKTKTIDIYEQIGSDKGAYFMEALNLRQPPTFTSKTTEFYTQLKPVGKNGLTINIGGKDYVENYTYSKKKLMKVWKDERYTIPASLEEDARLKLEELCRPTVAYEVDVIDLAKTSEAYKEILQYSLGDVVTLVSKTSGIREKMRIVKITEYPNAPQDNTCQLSTAKKSFVDIQEETKDDAVAEATATAAANTKEAVDAESDVSSEEIQLSMQGLKTEILKDVSDSYLTKDAAQNIASEAATAAAEETKSYMDEQLESYATEKKMTDEITAAKKSVMQDVAKDYAKKETMTATQQLLNQEMSQLQLDVENRCTEVEEQQGCIRDTDGKLWRMGIQKGCLFFERLEE